MKYKMTNIAEGVTVLYDEDYRAAAVDLNSELSRILYADCDPDLLAAAEFEAVKAGKTMMIADFSSLQNKQKDFLENNGYKIETAGKIYEIDVLQFFSAGLTEKCTGRDEGELIWIPFRDLISFQAEELLDEFEKLGMLIRKEELLRFNNNLSGVVYDRDNNIAAFDLISEYGEDLVFECLYGRRSDYERCVTAALYGFGGQLKTCNISESYRRILLYEIDSRNMDIMKELSGGSCELKEAGNMLCARKNLNKNASKTGPGEIAADYGAERKMSGIIYEKLKSSPLQSGINWKVR